MSSSSINTGTVNVSPSGTTYISGTSSGINTSALIDAAVSQRNAAADRIDVRIENNQARVTGYNELTTLANDLKTSLANLRQNYGFSTTSTSAFNRKAGSFTTSGGTGSAANIMGVTLADSANVGTYSIKVIERAQAQKVASAATASNTADLGYTGTFSIGLAGAGTASINVTADMSLQEIASAINSQRSTTHVNASVLKVGENNYQLVLTGGDTAKQIQLSDTSGTVMQSLGIIDAGGAFLDEVQEAKQAQLELDGLTITRDSNIVNDLIDGVTLNIKSADPNTTIELDVTNDTSQITDTIAAFVDAYNALRTFVATNQSVSSDGTVSEDAVLYGDNLMKTMSQQIQSMFATQVNTGSPISTLRDIGLTVNADNFLEIDAEVLADALADNLSGVRALFETQITNPEPNFALLGNTSSNNFGSLNFSITSDGTNVTDVTVNGQAGMFDIVGSSIVGKTGTIYEGLRFAYIGTTSTSFSMNLNQGVGDLLSNTINRYTDSLTGLITQEVQRVNDSNTELDTQAARIRERSEAYRSSLIAKYASFEAVLSRSNSTLTQLRALLGTDDDS